MNSTSQPPPKTSESSQNYRHLGRSPADARKGDARGTSRGNQRDYRAEFFNGIGGKRSFAAR